MAAFRLWAAVAGAIGAHLRRAPLRLH
jgi:hypothetical protein